jgi:acetamidase/formamidase
MKAEVNVHIHHHTVDLGEIKQLLSTILTTLTRVEQTMAKSAEVQAMEDAVTTALNDITNDIQTLLTRSTGLSEEDKAALVSVAEKAAAVAKIFDSGSTPV